MNAPALQPENQIPAGPEQMLQIISGFWISRAVYVIAKLGIADLLNSGPKTAEELARSTETHPPSLYRLLRALTSVGVLASAPEGRFALTPVSETLVTDARSRTGLKSYQVSLQKSVFPSPRLRPLANQRETRIPFHVLILRAAVALS